MPESSAVKVDEIISTLLADSMGWRTKQYGISDTAWHNSFGKFLYSKSNWNPTANLDQTIHIIEHLNKKGFLLSITQHQTKEYIVNIIHTRGTARGACCFKGNSLPMMICKAAVQVLRILK